MEIIAHTTGGFLIQATETEVKQILSSALGNVPEKINIGQKIPAIDYGAAIIRIKELNKNTYFNTVVEYSNRVTNEIQSLKNAINNAANIEV